ncbi:MAG TPA: aryl-sulfate sulfotransferase [Gammaproteobacteria bacterium]
MNKTITPAVFLGLVVAVAAWAQQGSDTGSALAGPLVIEMNPSGRAPLAGVASFTTTEPVRATITVTDNAGHSFSATSGDEPATEHEIMLLGFRPSRPHQVSLTLETANGASSEAARVSVISPELPYTTVPLDVTAFRPDAMEPGLTMIPMFRWMNQNVDPTYGQMVVVDDEGEIVWYYEAPHTAMEYKRLANGNLLYLGFDRILFEIDMLGNPVRHWHASGTVRTPPDGSIPVDVDTFHHDMLIMPSGNILALATEVREVADWYTSETDPDAPRETQQIISDVLVEFEPDGTIINRWNFFDLIDPYRIGYGSLAKDFYAVAYEGILEEPAPDWTHMNGIDYDPATDSIVISTNHLSTVFKLDRATGELEWMFGDPTGWREPWSELLLEPEDPDMLWSYHHHTPKWTSAGTLLLYDNGAARALPFNPPLTPEQSFSRAVEYAIDEDRRTIREIWTYGGPGPDDERFLSSFVSEVDLLPRTGNILVTSGGRVRDREGNPLLAPFQGHPWLTITEVTHRQPAEKIWEVAIDDPRWGMSSFRADRIESLYWGTD